MAPGTTRRIADNNHPALQVPETDDASFAIVLTSILNLQSHPSEYLCGVNEVQPAISEGFGSLRWIEGDSHGGYCIYNNHGAQRQRTVRLMKESNGQVELRDKPDQTNMEGALVWLERAAKQGNDAAKMRLAAILAANPSAEIRNPARALTLSESLEREYKDDPSLWEIKPQRPLQNWILRVR